MEKRFISIDPKTLKIVDSFFTEDIDNYGGRSNSLIHMLVDRDINIRNTKIIKVSESEYKINPIVPEEQYNEEYSRQTTLEAFKELRQERNRRLAEADWVTLRAYSSGTDVPEEWMTYMQALRDLPSVTKDPTNPVWPEPPNPSLVGEKMEKLAPRVSFLETSVASLISLDKQLNYKNAEMEILDIKVKNIESRLGMIEETLTSILSKLNI